MPDCLTLDARRTLDAETSNERVQWPVRRLEKTFRDVLKGESVEMLMSANGLDFFVTVQSRPQLASQSPEGLGEAIFCHSQRHVVIRETYYTPNFVGSQLSFVPSSVYFCTHATEPCTCFT